MRRTHPVVFLILIVPFGAMSGYLSVAIAYQLTQAGVSVDRSRHSSRSANPANLEIPVGAGGGHDAPRARRGTSSPPSSAAGHLRDGRGPHRRPIAAAVLYAVVLVANVAVTFLAMAIESLMVCRTTPEFHGRAGGWFQAGNLGGDGVGGGAGLWMAENLPEPGWPVRCLRSRARCARRAHVRSRAPPFRAPISTGAGSSRCSTISGRSPARGRGILALLICFLPIGTGAVSDLWSAVADDWHASADTVALVTGVLGGIVSAVGCLVGGYCCDRMDRKTAYALYGLLQAVCAIAMAIAPRTEPMYVVFTPVYAFI